MSAIAVEALGRGRGLLDPALRTAVDRLDPHTRLVTSYHLGWCDEQGRPLAADTGKAVRPGLVFLASEAVGGSAAEVVPGAVAVELVHNFSLVHDDLMDRDTERRHRRTVWSIWGDPTAVLVGDAMLSLAHEVLDEADSPYALAADKALTVATRELIRGQVLDVAFEQRDDVGLAECIDMAAGKTGALLGVSAELGAVLAGAGADATEAFRCFGNELGIAFQLVDDLLGIWGWPERTGKPVFSDLRSRKKTMPVVHALEYGGAAGRELAAWLADPRDPDDSELRRAADLVDRAGGRDWARDEARRRITVAGAALDGLSLEPVARAQLDELARFIVERDL
ncbi:polyprenyl synthetase family protein [Nocardioides terrisoli]|uniref:polyprenyl synthetase family protein n=1 Tax=Nocardioides terrisoli TaxID=3388267 RepID=UPI00287BB27B|nr:polyprenyl synthetase family protein [Nocardioides marmorisolisilvae]